MQRKNIAASPFQDKIKGWQADIKNWDTNKKYDAIISNPPFMR
jgi:tRNA1(Val) A37 N6-methylase TrmN6